MKLTMFIMTAPMMWVMPWSTLSRNSMLYVTTPQGRMVHTFLFPSIMTRPMLAEVKLARSLPVAGMTGMKNNEGQDKALLYSITAVQKKLKLNTHSCNQRHSSANNNNNNETPLSTMFIANTSNRHHHKKCRLPLDPQSYTSWLLVQPQQALTSIRAEPPAANNMNNRVVSRLFKTIVTSTPTEASPVKSIAAKAYDNPSKKDDGINNFVSNASDSRIQSSQDLAMHCIDFQHRLGN